jgi:hypothetical protein
VTAKRRKADILKEIATKIGFTVDDLVMVGIDDQYFYAALTLKKPEERLVGSAAVTLQSLTLGDVTVFKGEASLLGHQTGQDRVWPLVVMPANGGFTRNFLIANRPASDLVISAWSLTATQPPIAVAKQDLLIRHVTGDATPDLIADFDPYVTNTWSLTETMSLISFANDSLYLFDARRGAIDVAFHPIFEGMDVRIGRDGHWAIFLRGGSRVFLFDSHRTE